MSTWRRRQMLAASVPLVQEEYIVFDDPVVEQICATNWGDGIGLKPSQAARVTSIANSVFSGNTQITSFKELMYFGITNIDRDMFRDCSNLLTIGIPAGIQNAQARNGQFRNIHVADLDAFLSMPGGDYPLTPNGTGSHLYRDGIEVTAVVFPTGLTTIGAGLLRGMDSITSITLPSTATSIGGAAFRYAGMTSVSFPEGLTSIGNAAFANSTSLTGVITLPSTLTSIGSDAFRFSNSISAFKCLATTPPTLALARDVNTKATYVPYSSDHSILAAYQAATGWKDLTLIELDENGNIPS